jgi:predicted component of type VI protein secretion system
MSRTNRVVWQEDVSLRAQYFRQQERWMVCLARGREHALHPHPWGLLEYVLDSTAHGTCRDVVRCADSVGPSPDAVYQPLPHSERGLCA